MRKIITTTVVIALILSILGTGVVVFVETNTVSAPGNISGE